MGLTEKYETWKKKVKDRRIFRELLAMTKEEIEASFYKDLDFGTAGIRGIMGAGTNRLNVYTIRKITQGLALHMRGQDKKKVAISYDSRLNSELFAREAACVFAAADISVVITSELMPSPFLSYMTRSCADYGVMITASHNPKEYNGYKVYDDTGCQIGETEAKSIAACISRVDAFRLRVHSFDFYVKKGTISFASEKLETGFMEQAKAVAGANANADLTVVYTPLCGTGYRLVPELLKQLGCKVVPVESQSEPNGKFSTCPSPNPEKKDALRYGIRELKNSNADLLIATDPDADRIGVAYMSGGDAKILNGNQIGVLLTDHLLSHYGGGGTPVILRTIVSTDMTDRIAERYGAKLITVPTGFKYIGEAMNSLASTERFVLGFEESQGYLAGVHVRDKDAVSTAGLIAVMASELKASGKTFDDKLEELYVKYGFYSSEQFTFRLEGEEGERRIKALFDRLREQPLSEIASKPVKSSIDYLFAEQPVDMIGYEFGGGRLLVRPSGTEPLVKVYIISHIGRSENEKLASLAKKQFDELIKATV